MKPQWLYVFTFALSACGSESDPVAAQATPASSAQSEAAVESASPSVVDALVNRVWKINASATEQSQPGRIRIFLDNGVFLQGSCWEPFRLSNWRKSGPGSISWNEDGVEIHATFSPADPAVIMTMQLVNEARSERLSPMDEPFTCPDYPK